MIAEGRGAPYSSEFPKHIYELFDWPANEYIADNASHAKRQVQHTPLEVGLASNTVDIIIWT